MLYEEANSLQLTLSTVFAGQILKAQETSLQIPSYPSVGKSVRPLL